MKRLGEVLHVAKNNYIIVKIEDPDRIPKLGVKVFDEFRRELGQLLDVIGPVSQPYAVVKPLDKRVVEMVKPGLVAYYLAPRPKKHRRREKKKGRRMQRQSRKGPAARRKGEKK